MKWKPTSAQRSSAMLLPIGVEDVAHSQNRCLHSHGSSLPPKTLKEGDKTHGRNRQYEIGCPGMH